MSTISPASDEERFAKLELEDGSLVIYDQQNPKAWVQSDVSIPSSTIP